MSRFYRARPVHRCPVCNALMPYESIARHIAAHHPMDMDLAHEIKRRFKHHCPIDGCMASFQSHDRLRGHLRFTDHTPPPPLPPPLQVGDDGMIVDLPPWDAPLQLLGEPCRPLPDISMEDCLYSA